MWAAENVACEAQYHEREGRSLSDRCCAIRRMNVDRSLTRLLFGTFCLFDGSLLGAHVEQ